MPALHVVLLAMKRNQAVKTISLSPEIMASGMARAKAFGLKFSHYIGMLIERDVESGETELVIRAKPSGGSHATI